MNMKMTALSLLSLAIILLHYGNAQLFCTENSLRLVGGDTPYEGRVEICLRSEWGTVCDDDWDNDDASVVCAQLGFPRQDAQSFRLAHFGEGTGEILLDNVRCDGDETRLIDCDHRTIDNCRHREDAGVRCQPPPIIPCATGEVRLAGSTSRVGEGRVEVCINQEWGTVCDDLWDNTDASVVCKQLGYSRINAQGLNLAHFGQGAPLPILMDDVRCTGTEARLTDCNYDRFTADCSHFEDASVRCQITPFCRDGEVRLRGGTLSNEGRVEVCVNEIWGTVCDDLWSSIDAGVVCAQLGYSRQDAIVILSFGAGTGPILFDNLDCDGSESTLLQCPYDRDTTDCTHIEDAGVRCSVSISGECDHGAIRLVQLNGGPVVLNGQTIQGRVEVCVGDEWGTVCDDFWDDVDSGVACRQLGYSRFNSTSIRRFGGGIIPIKLDDVGCSGDEYRLIDCTYNSRENCNHFEDAGVNCAATLFCRNGDIRLVNGPSSMEGRVEVCWNETWGTVCDNDWSINDAKVACRQLGFSALSVSAFTNAEYGQGTGPILLNRLQCSGTETTLTSCSHNGIGNAAFCRHSDDAGVRCRAVTCENGDLRLAAGLSSFEGRVEMCWNERWGTVCDDFWGEADAQVVCRQLGFTGLGAVSFRGMSEGFGAGVGAILLDNVQCTGTEQRLVDCSHSGIGNNDCLHNEDAGVRCPQCAEGSIRLVGGSNRYEGRVEVCIGGDWGTVCDDGWADGDAAIACKQLGFSTQNAVAVRNAALSFGQGTGTIAMDDVSCISTDQRLVDCSHRNSQQIRSCTHFEDAGIRCQAPLPGAPLNLISQALSDTTVTLSWSPPVASQPILRYNVICSATGYPSESLSTHTGSTTIIIVIGLQAYVTYSCCVSAVTISGQGNPTCSNVLTHQTRPSAPPQNFMGHALSATSLTLSWAPPLSTHQNGPIQEYHITITEVDSGRMLTYITTSTNLGITALHPYYTYQCSVAAVTIDVGPPTQPLPITTFQAAPSGPPLELTSSSSTNVSFTIHWDPPHEENRNGIITGYTLSVTHASTGAITTHSVNTNTLTVGSLQPHTLYTCVVAAMTVNGTGPASERIEAETMEGEPSLPRQVGAEVLNSSSLRLFWSPPDVENGIIRGYKVRLTEVDTGTQLQFTTEVASITIPALHPHYYYRYTVAAFTIIDGPYSFSREVQMPEHVPSASPQNLAPTAVTETTISIMWDPPAIQDQNGFITHYTVSYYTLPEGIIFTADTLETFYVLSSLRPATTHIISVSASTRIGAGPLSSHIIVRTITGVPTVPPSGVQLTPLNSRTLRITWNPPVSSHQGGPIIGYNISLTENETGQHFDFTTGDESYTVSSLHPYYHYVCQVLAYTAIGSGPTSPEVVKLMPEDVPSGYPQDLNVTVQSAFLITLSWNPPLESERNGIITGYFISVTIEMGETVQLSSTATSMDYTAQPYKSYEFIVAAGTIVGRGPYSPEEAVQTPEIAPTHVPQNLIKEVLSATSFRLVWSAPPIEHHNGVITEYRVNVTEADTGAEFRLSTTETEITITNLHPYYLYVCTVTAVTVDEGPYTAFISVRTEEAAPSAAPLDFQVILLSATSIRLEWSPPPDESHNGIIRKYSVIVSNIATGDQIQELAFAESLTIPALLPYNTYLCKVAAYTVAIGPFTAVTQITTSDDVPSGPPRAVKITPNGTRGLVITWNPPRPEHQNGVIIRYTVRTIEINTGRVYQNDTTSTALSLSALHPFYTYHCSVAAWTSSGQGPFSSNETEQLPEDAPASAPFNVQAVVISSTVTRISWSAPIAEDRNGIIRQYHINLTPVNVTGRQWNLVSNTNSLLLDFLSPHYTYQYRVAAVTVGQGPFTEIHYFTTLQDIPGSPINLTTTKIDSRTLKLTWEPPPEEHRNGVILSYTVTVTVLSPPGPASELVSLETSLTIGELLPSRSYVFSVAAETNIGRGPAISIHAQLSEDIPTGPPQNLEGIALDSKTLQLSWSPPLMEETNGLIRDYKINIIELETGTVTQHEAVHSILVVMDQHPFYTYQCFVAAYTVGAGPTANVTIQMPPDVPTAAPLNLESTILSSSSVVLNWDPPPSQDQNGNITLYVINVNSLRNGASVLVETESTNHQITSLEAFSTYEFSVAAETVEGRGPFTQTVTVSTPEDVPSAAPTVGETLRISATEIQISWSPLPEELSRGIITGYFIKYRPFVRDLRRNLDDMSTVLETTETSFVINDLDPRFEYGVAVAAGTAVGVGNYSMEIIIELHENSLFQLHLAGAIVCLPWLSDGAADKVEDIIEHVAIQLQEACNCQISGKYIRRSDLFCGDHSTDRVIFQAAVIGTESTSSEEILADMQEWVYTKPILVSRGVQLMVLPCSVYLTEYGNTTCINIATATTIPTVVVTSATTDSTEAAGDSGPVIGIYAGVAGGIVVLILFIVVLIILVVGLRRRQKKSIQNSQRPDLRLNITLDDSHLPGSGAASKEYDGIQEYSKKAEADAEASFGYDQDHIYDEPAVLTTFVAQPRNGSKPELPPPPAYNSVIRDTAFAWKQPAATAAAAANTSSSSDYSKLNIDEIPVSRYKNITTNASSIPNDYEDLASHQTSSQPKPTSTHQEDASETGKGASNTTGKDTERRQYTPLVIDPKERIQANDYANPQTMEKTRVDDGDASGYDVPRTHGVSATNVLATTGANAEQQLTQTLDEDYVEMSSSPIQ